MELLSDTFKNGDMLPVKYAFGKRSDQGKIDFAPNLNPPLCWKNLPPKAASLVLTFVDHDAPQSLEGVNQEGCVIEQDRPRQDFHHWGLYDIPANLHAIQEGQFARGVVKKGKTGPQSKLFPMLETINNYTQWFQDDGEMGGDYFGYDGPCPPWNDSKVHHYTFTLYALSVPKVEIQAPCTNPQLLAQFEDFILDKATLKVVYAIQPQA